ncbi:hypothetical protein HDU76_009044 [Blyttiomyces sp. JEL0837]|nr:hypothetical protein HDU76_009044 [Blyttiomyces sp. JEL0837]
MRRSSRPTSPRGHDSTHSPSQNSPHMTATPPKSPPSNRVLSLNSGTTSTNPRPPNSPAPSTPRAKRSASSSSISSLTKTVNEDTDQATSMQPPIATQIRRPRSASSTPRKTMGTSLSLDFEKVHSSPLSKEAIITGLKGNPDEKSNLCTSPMASETMLNRVEGSKSVEFSCGRMFDDLKTESGSTGGGFASLPTRAPAAPDGKPRTDRPLVRTRSRTASYSSSQISELAKSEGNLTTDSSSHISNTSRPFSTGALNNASILSSELTLTSNSLGSVKSGVNALSAPTVFKHDTSVASLPESSVMVPCFQNTANGYYVLEDGWERQVFDDKRYDVWRKTMIEVLTHQVNYPLIVPPELGFLLSEEDDD